MDRFRIGAAVAVLIAILAFLGYLVHEKADPTMMTALAVVIGGAITAVVTYIARGPTDPTKGPPPGALAFVLSVGTVLASTALLGCSPAETRRVEAAGAYANDDMRCADAVPKLGPDAGLEAAQREWAKYDACQKSAHTKWSIAPSAFAKDGGQ